MFGSLGFKFVIRTVYFVEIARALGVANYGAFIGVLALVGVAAPFGDLGSSSLLVQHVSRDKAQFGVYWGRGLVTTCVTSVGLIAIVCAVSTMVLPATISTHLVLVVAVADVFGSSIITMAAEAYQAVDRLNGTAAINVAAAAGRLIGATALVAVLPHPSAFVWGCVYLASTLVVAVPAMLLVTLQVGAADVRWHEWVPEIRQGAHFSIGQCAQTIYNDIDKTMLARLASFEATGIYGAAYRCIDVSFVPVASLLQASYSEFFRTGANGIAHCVRFVRPLWKWALGYALGVAVVLFLCSGVLPDVLGPGYSDAAEALRWLAVLPALKVVSYFFSNVLTGANHQGSRACLQVGVGVFNVLINLWLIPAYSWRGAAWSSIASDGLLAIGAGAVVFVIARHEKSNATETRCRVAGAAAGPVLGGVWIKELRDGEAAEPGVK